MTDDGHGATRGPSAPDPYWLRHSHGFRVVSARGRVGIVEDVLYGADRERPSALAVRGGLFGTRVEIVPVEEVAHVIPRSKLLSLRADQRRAA
ncbi:MAG TPA: hypothetical protein VFO88_07795 [Gaiellaceae bacterium]|nr:hypothetical protein [Gaiellaceae bacterium]